MHLKVHNAIIYTKLIITSLVFSYDEFDREVVSTKNVKLEVKNFSADFEIPWGMAFLPDTSMLVTDLSGSLYRVYQDGNKDVIKGTPNVHYKGQGGLLDVEATQTFSIIIIFMFLTVNQKKVKPLPLLLEQNLSETS